MFNGYKSISPIVSKVYMMIPYCQKELYSYHFNTLNFNFKNQAPASMVYYLKGKGGAKMTVAGTLT